VTVLHWEVKKFTMYLSVVLSSVTGWTTCPCARQPGISVCRGRLRRATERNYDLNQEVSGLYPPDYI